MKTSCRSNDDYKVKDLGEAAFLLGKGQILVGLERSATFSLFVFSNRTRCEELGNDYWTGHGTISARKFVASLRELKDMLFSRPR